MTSTLDKHSQALTVTLEDITCTLCCKMFTSPALVDCLHSYCQLCIKDNLTEENQRLVFKCPQCKHETELIDSSADSLVADIHISGLIKIFKFHTCVEESTCVVCSLKGCTVEATHQCLDCDDSLCEQCAKGHTASSLTVSHKVVSLSDLKQGMFDQDILNRKTLHCKNHHNEACRIYCHTCSEPACVLCVISIHKDHVCDDIHEAAEKKCLSLRETLKSNPKLSSLSPPVDVTAEADLDQLKIDEATFVRDVTETTASLIDKIKQQSQSVLEKGHRCFAEEQKRRQNIKAIASLEKEKQEHIMKVSKKVLEAGGLPLLVMEQAIQKGILLISKQESEEKTPLRTFSAAFHIPLNKEFISVNTSVLPTLHSETNETNLHMQNKSGDEVSLSKNTEVQGLGEIERNSINDSERDGRTCGTFSVDEKVIGVKLKYKRNFATSVRTDKENPEIASMAFGIGFSTCLLLDKNNAKLKVYKCTGDMAFLVDLNGKCNLFTQFVQTPNGNICAVFQNYLLVLSKHLKPHCKIVLIPKGDFKEEPVIANFGENIIVGNLPDNEMRVFNISGKVLRSWKREIGSKIASLSYAGEDKVVTSSWSGGGSVHVESEKGGLLLTIQGVKRKGMKWHPVSPVVCKRGDILVADTQLNEISIFSSTGKQLYLLDTMLNSVCQPHCLIVDETGNLYVSYNGSFVAVYKIQYY